jgi:uncharacterized protein
MAKKIVHVEFPSGDGDRAQRFWSELADWSFTDTGQPGIDYRMHDGGDWGAAVWTSEDGGKGPVVYFDSDDIDADLAKVRELGGNAEDKQPIPGIGWFARCADTEGNSFSLYQRDENASG